MDTQKIINKISEALKKCSEEYKIEPNAIQIKIVNPKTMFEGIKFYVMNSLMEVQQVKIKELLNLTSLEAMFVETYLKDTLTLLAKNKNIDPRQASARIFTKSIDFTPSVYLQEGTKNCGEITIEQLTSK